MAEQSMIIFNEIFIDVPRNFVIAQSATFSLIQFKRVVSRNIQNALYHVSVFMLNQYRTYNSNIFHSSSPSDHSMIIIKRSLNDSLYACHNSLHGELTR